MLPGDDKKYDIGWDPLPPFETSFVFLKTLNFMNDPLGQVVRMPISLEMVIGLEVIKASFENRWVHFQTAIKWTGAWQWIGALISLLWQHLLKMCLEYDRTPLSESELYLRTLCLSQNVDSLQGSTNPCEPCTLWPNYHEGFAPW